jgi:hypothetical protein
MKSGPTLYGCTFIRFDSDDIMPVAIEVFPAPLPAPAINAPFI